MPLGEAIEIALRELYSSDLAQEMPRLKVVLTNVQNKCNGNVQSDGLAMGASLAVILANVRMKSFEASLQKPELREKISRSNQNGKCKHCNRRVTFRGRRVEFE